jgi:hypothetical protein
MRTVRLIAILLAGGLLATACTFARLGYGALPIWATWQLDSYLSLDTDQHLMVSRRIDELQRWHRQTQLSQYAAFLAEVDDKTHGRVEQSDVARWRERITVAWDPLAGMLAPGMAELLLSLRADQVDRLRSRMDKANAKLRRDYQPTGGRTREDLRVERIVERAEFFLGDLSVAQKREVRAAAEAMPATEDAYLAERAARQARLLALIERLRGERPAQAIAECWCEQYLRTLWVSPDPQRREQLERASAGSDAISLRLLNSASEPQRRHLSATLRSFAEDFTRLARAD